MSTSVSIQDLKMAQSSIQAIKAKYPDKCEDIKKIFRAYSRCGYSNLCKMFIGKATPESLTYGYQKYE